MIELGTTDEEGKAYCSAVFPHGKYYIQEVEHKPGYLPREMMRCIPLMRLIQTRPLNCSLFQKKFLISLPLGVPKVDLTGGQEIGRGQNADPGSGRKSGRRVGVREKKREAHVVYALAPGEYYCMKSRRLRNRDMSGQKM